MISMRVGTDNRTLIHFLRALLFHVRWAPTACKDRTSSLFETLPTWQAALGPTDEIIVIDWSTSKDLLSVYDHMKTLRDPRLFCARVQDQDKWILSLAYNYAAQFANGNFILKVDCDTKLHPKFLEQHPLEEAENTFYRVAWTKTRDENEQHLSGVLFTPRKHFEEVRGYDERIQSYGWDDSDLYKRLEEMQVTAKDIDLEYARHIEHEDVIRAADQDDLESPMFHTQVSSLDGFEKRGRADESSLASAPGFVDSVDRDQRRNILPPFATISVPLSSPFFILAVE